MPFSSQINHSSLIIASWTTFSSADQKKSCFNFIRKYVFMDDGNLGENCSSKYAEVCQKCNNPSTSFLAECWHFLSQLSVLEQSIFPRIVTKLYFQLDFIISAGPSLHITKPCLTRFTGRSNSISGSLSPGNYSNSVHCQLCIFISYLSETVFHEW